MAADLGALTIWIALALAAYASVASFLGAWRRVPELVTSGRYAAYLLPLVLAITIASLVASFLFHDFSVRYVALHSNLAMDRWLTWVAFYAGNEGSLLFIAGVLAGLSALAIVTIGRRLRHSQPYTTGVLMLVLTFFVAVLGVLANPFVRLAPVPVDGQGINPLLTHPGMFFHPPALMTGLVGVTVPFAIAMGALLSGRVDDGWLKPARTWAMITWLTLGAGNLLGSWWAYTILGWGGYWGWDPVENAGFMPWLVLTAFIHSLRAQMQRGVFRMWNMALVIIAFALASFGMFLNRGGPVPSVHSFGASTLGWVFLIFLGVAVVVPFGIFFWRYDRLRGSPPLESSLSREAAFLVNNLLFLAITFVTLWGVVFPLISELTKSVTVTVARPFYDQVNGPLFLALIFLMGVAPLLPWRRASLRSFWRAIALPLSVALITIILLMAFRVRQPYALAAFGLCSLVAAGILREWARGTLARHSKGESYPQAFFRLLAANRPRYGGYIVHLAVVLIALAVAGSSFFDLQKDVILRPGQEAEIGSYRLQYLGSRTESKPDRTETIATVRAYHGDRLLGTYTPWRADYPAWKMASTRAAIRSTPLDDLYIIPSEFAADGSMAFRLHVNPLVWWLWVGGPVLLLGSLVALWPERRPAALRAAVPQGAWQPAVLP